MKKAIYLLLTLAIVATSCQKAQPLPQAIQGKWHLYKTALVTDGERKEMNANDYYEFSESTVKVTDQYSQNDYDYFLDEANNKLKIGPWDFAIESFKPKEMLWRFEGIMYTVIDGELVKTTQVNYYYLRKE